MLRTKFDYASSDSDGGKWDGDENDVECETCEECNAEIVGIRHHKRGTFTDLCSEHFDELAEEERAAYDAIDSALPPTSVASG
jgi:hypothetical protein